MLSDPYWVEHSGYPIFSASIHPDGTRFVTGGGDNRVKIWNMKPAESKEEEDNPSVPKLLCSMENHYGPVNCVRWSPDGKYLASGSDDKLIIIWQLTPGRTKVFGQETEMNEHWRAINTLKGHVADVADLAWAPDGTKLVSCSFDNRVIVWDILTFALLKQLDGHSGWVKGVAWDPTGKFIASHSEDHSLIIWRTMDWTVEKKITDLFEKFKGGSYFLRLSFSADGSYLTCGQGTNRDGVKCAYALSRGTNWGNACEFVGHREAVLCAAWNPRIFRQNGHNNGNPYSLCCVGSADRSISIWSTGGTIPILVCKELQDGAIFDVSWSRDGRRLLMAGNQGKVQLVIFKENELGIPLPVSEIHDMLKKNYGDSARSNTTLPDNPLQLQLEKMAAPQQPAKPTSTVATTPSQGINILQPRVKSTIAINQPQVVSTTSDGRKRITPTLVSQIPLPSTTTTTTTTSSASMYSSDNNNITTTMSSTTASTSLATSISSLVTPTSTSDTTTTSATTSTSTDTITAATSSTSMEIESGGIEVAEPTTSLTITIPGKETESNKRKETDKESASAAKKQKLKEKLKEKEKEKSKKKTKEKEIKSAREKRRESGSISSRHIKAKLLPLPEVQTKITYVIKQTNNIFSQSPISIDVNYSDVNSTTTTNSIVTSHINVTSGTKPIWEDRIKGQVSLVSGNTKFVAIATSDSSLYIYSMSGRHELPCIVLGDTIHSLTCNKAKHLMVITVTGRVYVWDIPNQQLTISANIDDFIESQGIIKRSLLTEEGLPILTFANLYTYCYHGNMKVFCRVGDDKFGESEYTSVLPPMKSMGLLSQLQSQAIPNIAPPTVQSKNIESISHLENQVASSLILGSASEYKYWMELYIRKLTHDANELKLREICNMLLGPPMKLSAIGKSWEANILGHSKRELLGTYLKNVISGNRALQRLVNEFTDNLANLAEDQ